MLIGTLTVLSVATTTVAFQSLLGVVGTGVAIILFVILGNPGAGGAAPPEMLPGLWRATGRLIPNGAALTGIRDAVYFPNASLAGRIAVLISWFVLAAAIAVTFGSRGRGMTEREAEISLAAASAAA
jgi:ABC-type multidrug transport system permease subunit